MLSRWTWQRPNDKVELDQCVTVVTVVHVFFPFSLQAAGWGGGASSCSDKFLGAARGAGGGDGVFGCRFPLGA